MSHLRCLSTAVNPPARRVGRCPQPLYSYTFTELTMVLTHLQDRTRTAVVLAALAMLAAGCNDSPTGNGQGSISITLNPTSATIAQGGSGTVDVTVTRQGSFSGVVTVSVTGAPAGVTAAVDNAVTTNDVTTADITIDVAPTTAPGAYNIVARAQGSGVTEATATFTLTVAQASSFALSLSSQTMTVLPGGNSPVTVNLARTNFTGGITLALEGAPTGITGAFSPNPATGNTATLTVSAGAAVAPGTHTLTVRASAAGLPDQTATIALTVNASTFALSLSSNAATIAPGGSSPITVNLARTNFTGAVALTLEGAPTGVSGTFNPASATGTSSILTISVASGTAAGVHTLTVRGAATGQTDKTATITLTISAAPSFTLSLNPAALTLVQGTAGSTEVQIARSSFTGAVTLSLANAPTGVTGAFSPTAPTGNTSTLTLTVGSSTAPGTYNLSVNGSGTPGNRSTPLTLTVTAAANYQLSLSPTAVSVTQGSTGSTTVNIARTSFTGAVTLSLGNAPTGVTGAFNPTAPTGNTSTLTLTVGSSVTPGVYNLTVNGTATPGNRSAALTLTVTAAANFSLSLSAPALSVAQGANGSTTVNIARTNFTGAVALTLLNAPAGVTGSFNPASATGNSSALTITVGSAVAAGVYNLTVNGVGTPGTRTVGLALTVTATTTADYALSVTPTTLPVAQGSSGNATVAIARTNFTGAVALSLTGLPSGATASFNPASATGNSSTLTINVGTGVAAGSYTLTITGTGTPGTRTTTLTLTVTASGGSSITASFASCPAADRPVWVAFQDGTGPWTRITSTNDTYTFSIASGRGGFAYVRVATGGESDVIIQYFTAAELSGTLNFCAPPTPTGKTVNGTVAGVDNTQSAQISLGFGTAVATSFTPNFQIMGVQNGVHDLVGYRRALTGGNTPSDRAIIRRDQDIPNGGSVGTLDFNGTGSFAVASATITLGGTVGGESLLASMSYYTGSACSASQLYVLLNAPTSIAATGIPTAQQRTTDRHGIFAQAAAGTTAYRTVSEWFHTLANRTVTFGAALPNPSITQPSGPYKRLQASYTLPTGYNQTTFLGYEETSGSKGVSISASLAYLGGPATTLAMPDFSTLSGWNNSWPPASGSTVDWIVGALGFTGSSCGEGAKSISAGRTGTQ